MPARGGTERGEPTWREADGWKTVALFSGFDGPFTPGQDDRLSERGRRRHGLLGDPAEAR
jgi:hypothetical protein